MSSRSKPGWLGRIGTIAPIVSAVITLLLLILGGGFVYNNWFNVPDLAYTILPTYELENLSFGGLVVENRGRATAHDVSIRLTDLASSIEQYSVDSDELWALEEGGTGSAGMTIWLDRMTAGSSTTIYLLTSEPIELEGVAVRAEEGPGHPAAVGSELESILIGGATTALAALSLFSALSLFQRFRKETEKTEVDIRAISLPYDFIEHFVDAQLGQHRGSIIRLHPNAKCGQESMRGIFEHPPNDPNQFSTLAYNLTLAPGTRPLELGGFVGIQTEISEPAGRRMSKRDPENGVQFDILINGEPGWQKQKFTSDWEEFWIEVPRNRNLSICFRTNCLGNPQYNWSVWGEPVLIEAAE